MKSWIESAGQKNCYTFVGVMEQKITAFVDNLTNAGTEKIRLVLLKPDGTKLAQTTSEYGGYDAGLRHRKLPEKGTYTLIVQGVGDATGPYRLGFYRPSYRLSPIADGHGVEPKLKLGETHGYTFDAQAGEVVTAYVDNRTKAGTEKLRLVMLKPDGEKLAQSTSEYDGYDVGLRHRKLPEEGTYTLLVQGWGDATGPYRLGFFRPSYHPLPITDRKSKRGTIVLSGEAHGYTFDAQAGEVVTAYVDNRTKAGTEKLRLVMLKPDGEKLVQSTSEYEGYDVGLRRRKLPDEGTYTLLVQGWGDATGPYRLAFHQPSYRTSPIGDRNYLEKELKLGGAHGYTFEGEAGEVITAYVDNRTKAGTEKLRLVMLKPDGGKLVQSTSEYEGYDVSLRHRKLPEEGTYTLLVQGWGDATGPYRLGFYKPPFSTSPIAHGDLLQRELRLGEEHGFTFDVQEETWIMANADNRTTGNLGMYLLSPEGSEVTNHYPSYKENPSLQDVKLSRKGTYTLVMDGQGDATGTYELALTRLRVPIAGKKKLTHQDYFNDPGSGWSKRSDNPDYQVGYDHGKYRIVVKKPNSSAWAYPGWNIGDFVLALVAGPGKESDVLVSYSVLFRFLDQNNFYEFRVFSDGRYGVYKKKNGEWSVLVDPASSPHIQRGSRMNQIVIDAKGPRIGFYVNGKSLTEVTDHSFQQGDVALKAKSHGQRGAPIHFDNLRVWTKGD